MFKARGEIGHALKGLIKKLAEDRGFSVSLEVTVLEGHGYVDVVLERDGIRTACEISVSTRLRHEVGNLTKCLAAGFDYVALISSDEGMLTKARTEMSGVDQTRVRFLSTASLAPFLDEVGASPRRDVPSPSKAPPRKTATTGLPPGGEGKRALIARDAAEYLGMATQTLAKMRVSGESPPYYKVGRLVMYDRDDLDAWLRLRRRRSTSDKGPSGATKSEKSSSP